MGGGFLRADTGNARVVTGGETKETREAKRIAEERGLNRYLFGGDNLHISDGTETVEARAMIVGKNAFVRVDHPDYTADQLMRHEIGHDMIDSGEIDPKRVRERLKDTYTEKELVRIARAYIEAYKGSNLTPDEAWTEMICDLKGDMRRWWGYRDGEKNFLLTEEQYAAYKADFDAAMQEFQNRKDTGNNESRDSKNATTESGSGGKYSIEPIIGESGKNYGTGVYLDSTLLENLTDEERVQMVKERVAELGGQSFTAYDNDGDEVLIKIAEKNQRFKNKSGKTVRVNEDLVRKNRNNKIKQETIILADELIQTAKNKSEEDAKYPHGWLDNDGKNKWEKWTVFVQDKENTVWEATLHIANSVNGEKYLYDVTPIKKVEQAGISATSTTNDSISSSGEKVKQNFSREVDSSGKQLTEQQAEYFKDSKMRDKKGSIRPVYHYTDGEFTQFAEMGESNGSRRTLGDGYYEYKNATMTRRAELLEEKRDGVADATREDILSWLAKNRRSTEKKKKK